MTLDALRCFCAVVDAGSFRLAAERVHRSQPAVSQQIKALEKESGQVLLDRKTGSLTPAGRVVYEKGRGLIRAILTHALEVALADGAHGAAATPAVGRVVSFPKRIVDRKNATGKNLFVLDAMFLRGAEFI